MKSWPPAVNQFHGMCRPKSLLLYICYPTQVPLPLISMANRSAGAKNLCVNRTMRPSLSTKRIPSQLVFYALATAVHVPWSGYGRTSSGREHLPFWPSPLALFFAFHGLCAGMLSVFEVAWPIWLVPFASGGVFVQRHAWH